MAHRLVMEPQARFAGVTPQRVVQDVLDEVGVPI